MERSETTALILSGNVSRTVQTLAMWRLDAFRRSGWSLESDSIGYRVLASKALRLELFAAQSGSDSMVCANPAPWQPHLWRRQLKDSVTTVTELGLALGLSLEECDERGGAGFPLRVPRPFVARMRPNDPNDPLLR